MKLTTRFESMVRANVPPWAARFGKHVIVGPRYRSRLRAARQGYQSFGLWYSNSVLFVAGLPKSGTSWLESMLASFPGYQDIVIPEAIEHERVHGGSHAYDIPADMFDRFRGMLVIAKMHVHGSPHNVAVLRNADVPYLVMFRDLRDVAVSYVFYVRRTPWHPDHLRYKDLGIAEALDCFAATLLKPYMEWIRGWHVRRDPARSMELRYEDLLAAPLAQMAKVARFFNLITDPHVLRAIIQANSFEHMSTGRSEERRQLQSFFRKGVTGDWREHLRGGLKEKYKSILGDFLMEFRYERDARW